MNRIEILKKHSPEKENLLQILHDLQKSNPQQFISEDDMKDVASYLNMSLSSVYGVVTYYSMFSLKPRGRYIIRACCSPVCAMTGSEGIIKLLQNELYLKPGETSPDKLITLETTECLGRCDQSPGMLVNEHFHGNLDKVGVITIINSLKSGIV